MKYIISILLFSFIFNALAQEHYFYIRVNGKQFQNRGKSILAVPNTTLNSVKPLLTPKRTALLRKKGVATQNHRLQNIYKVTYTSSLSTQHIYNYLNSNFFIDEVAIIPISEPLTVVSDSLANTDKSPLIAHDFFSAWDISEGDSTIVIGVVDTGFRPTHEELKNKIKINHNDPIDGKNNDGDFYFGDSITDNYAGWDIADFDNDPTGSSGHGTWVASVAVAEHNGKGLAGSCPKCLLLPIKAAKDASQKSVSHGYDGLLYAAEHGAKVINLSWGVILSDEQYPQILKDLIYTIAVDMDVVIVAAGGNKPLELNYQPSSQEHVLGVTTMYQDTTIWAHATYNTDIDVVVQGGFVYVANNASDSSYFANAGSSLATPLVSGAAGLVRSKFPNYTSEQVIQKLRVTGMSIDSLVDSKYKEKIGFMLNPEKALADTTIPAIRIIETSHEDIVSGNGDSVLIKYKFVNYLYPTPLVNGSFSSQDTLSQVIDSMTNITSIAMLDTSNYYVQKIYIPPFTGDTITTTIRTGFSAPGYHDYQYKTFQFRKDHITSNSKTDAFEGISIFPNPIQQGETLYFSKPIQSLVITSLDGRIISSLNGEFEEIELPSQLASGLYILKTNYNTTTLTVQ